MSNSIQYFEEIGNPQIEKLFKEFARDPKKLAEFIHGIRDVHLMIAAQYIGDSFTAINDSLRRSGQRKRHWVIVKHNTRSILTCIGYTTYTRTLFRHKETGELCYLVDRVLGLKRNARMTEDAEALMLEEAVESSYRKGGQAVSIIDNVSKQTVMNHIHEIHFPSESEIDKPDELREVECLYIEADEDHIHLQFQARKGDLRANKLGRKNNGEIEKLIYVHEGIERVAPKSTRHRLINPHYFAGNYEGEDNKELWDEVYEYIRSHYDVDKIKKIYLNSDGGGWIKSGVRRLHGVERVIDEFHLMKYLNSMTRHVDDEDERIVRNLLKEAIRTDTKEDFKSHVDMLLFHAGTDEVTWKRVSKSADYILNNWMAAKTRLAYRDRICGSSTEGHVYHVLSSRMSTQPLGWSKLGGDKMAHLRAWYWNGYDMLTLVRYKNEIADTPMAAGAENDPISAASIMASEHLNVPDWSVYYERMQATIGESVKKSFSIILNRYL